MQEMGMFKSGYLQTEEEDGHITKLTSLQSIRS